MNLRTILEASGITGRDLDDAVEQSRLVVGSVGSASAFLREQLEKHRGRTQNAKVRRLEALAAEVLGNVERGCGDILRVRKR